MRLPLTRKRAVMGRLASVLSVATGILGVALVLYCLHAALTMTTEGGTTARRDGPAPARIVAWSPIARLGEPPEAPPRRLQEAGGGA